MNKIWGMAYRLVDSDNPLHDESFSYTKTLGWNLDAGGIEEFIEAHPGARFVIGVRE